MYAYLSVIDPPHCDSGAEYDQKAYDVDLGDAGEDVDDSTLGEGDEADEEAQGAAVSYGQGWTHTMVGGS